MVAAAVGAEENGGVEAAYPEDDISAPNSMGTLTNIVAP